MAQHPIHILYIDDNALDRELVHDALEKEHGGFALTLAATRAEFETRLAQAEYAVVLSDFNILGFEGLQVLDAVNAKSPRVPVVIVTGTGSEEIAAEAMKRGAADYVLKTPRHIRRLPQTIIAALERARLREERARAAEALRASEERFRALIENSADVIIVLTAEGIVQYASPALERVLGYRPAEIVGGQLVAFVHPDDQPAWQTALEYRLKYPDVAPVPARLRARDANGVYRILEGTGNNLLANPAVGGIVVNARDVTDRVRVEAQIAYQARVLENVNDAVIASDAHMRITAWNRGAERMYGWKEDEALGKPALEVMPTDFGDAAWETIARQLQASGEYHAEVVQTRRDGTRINVEVSMTALRDVAGKIIGWTSIHRDLTARKRAEQALARRADEFAALYDIARDLIAAPDLPVLLQTIVHHAARLLAASDAVIYLYDPARAELELAAAQVAMRPLGTRLNVREGAAGRVIQTRQPLIVNDYQTWEHRRPDVEYGDLRAVAQVPMTYGDEIIGVLGVAEIGKERKFTGADVHLLELLAAQAANAVHTARLFQETRTRAEEMTALNDVGRKVSMSLSPSQVAQAALEGVVGAVRPDLALFYLRDGDKLLLQGVAPQDSKFVHAETPEHRVGECLCGLAVTAGKPIYSGDIHCDARCTWDECKKAGLRSFAALPLRRGNEIIGVLGLAAGTERDFSAHDAFLETLAHSIAVGLQNARLFDETQRRAHHLALLNDITRAAIEKEDLHAILQTLADRLSELIAADGCHITLWDEAQHKTIPAAFGQFREMFPTLQPLPGETTMTESVLRAGHALVAEDVFDTPYMSPRIAAQFTARSLLGLPLIVGEQRLGAALIEFNQPHHFTPDEIARGEQAAGQIALAVAKARLLDSEKTARARAEILSTANVALTQTLDLDRVLNTLLQYLQVFVPYDSANVMLLEQDGAVVSRAVRGFERWVDPARQLGKVFDLDTFASIREVIATRASLVVADTRTDPRWVQVPEFDYIRSWLGVPLVAGGKIIGLYSIDKTEPGFFTPEHARAAEALAAQAAVAMENARLLDSERASRAQLQTLSRRLVEAEEAERRRLAQELHDSVGQNLTGLALNLNIMRNQLSAASAQSVGARLNDSLQLVDGTVQTIRDVMANLRPAVLDDYGLVAALRWYSEQFARRSHLRVEGRAPDPFPRLPAEIETALFRITQEALTNVVKHARATLVHITVELADARVRLTIADDGAGFAPGAPRPAGARAGMGLIGMQERAEGVGGVLRVESRPGEGTRVVVEVEGRSHAIHPTTQPPNPQFSVEEKDANDCLSRRRPRGHP